MTHQLKISAWQVERFIQPLGYSAVLVQGHGCYNQLAEREEVAQMRAANQKVGRRWWALCYCWGLPKLKQIFFGVSAVLGRNLLKVFREDEGGICRDMVWGIGFNGYVGLLVPEQFVFVSSDGFEHLSCQPR